MKNCGNCRWFIKWNDGGLCTARDARTTTDRGHRCTDHQALKYDRTIFRKIEREEVKHEYQGE